jgi:hypothetical protein
VRGGRGTECLGVVVVVVEYEGRDKARRMGKRARQCHWAGGIEGSDGTKLGLSVWKQAWDGRVLRHIETQYSGREGGSVYMVHRKVARTIE